MLPQSVPRRQRTYDPISTKFAPITCNTNASSVVYAGSVSMHFRFMLRTIIRALYFSHLNRVSETVFPEALTFASTSLFL